MSENLLYVLGTISNWIGWVLGVWVLIRLVLLVMPGSPSNRAAALGGIAAAAFVAAIALTIGTKLPALDAASHPPGVRLPLVWLVMPFAAWIAAVAIAMTLLRAAQALTQLTGEVRRAKSISALIWAAVAILFAVFYRGGSEKIEVLKGGINLSWGTAAAILFLIVAGGAGTRYAANRAGSRGWSKAILTHVMLIAGSVIFGLPFAFLLITSFKEDRDMSSPNGIVWVPKVQQTVLYMDPKDPLMQSEFKGRTVEGAIVKENGDGTVELEITRPASMRGLSAELPKSSLKEIPKPIPLVTGQLNGRPIQGKVVEELLDGQRRVVVTRPAELAGQVHLYKPAEVEPVREVGLRWQNYTEALEYLPPETANGLVYLKNTLIIVLLSVIGTVLSSSVVAYAFARMKFPGQNVLFALLLGTMMLPGAVTLLPKFLLFRSLGWIDTLYPLWVPAFFASAFNVFLLRQFFKNIPAELEDAARIDGCNPARTFWSVMLPLVKPALAVIAIWGFMNAWNNFMDPLIYISSPEKMPLSYALQLFQGDRQGEPGLLMAFATMSMVPVLLLFFFAQRYFVEGVTLSGLGGR